MPGSGPLASNCPPREPVREPGKAAAIYREILLAVYDIGE
jgi:hypothetical protein